MGYEDDGRAITAWERDLGVSSGTASVFHSVGILGSLWGTKSGPTSLFPHISYSEKSCLMLIAGDCCLLFIQCFCRCSRF